MHKMQSRQSGSTHTTCGQFTKTTEPVQEFNETGTSTHIYWNELDKSFF